MLAIRIGVLASGLGLAASDIADLDATTYATGTALAVYTGVRLVRPVRFTSLPSGLALIALDLAVAALAVNLTDRWDSPFVFFLVTSISLAGFACGLLMAVMAVAVAVLAVGVPDLVLSDASAVDSLRAAGQWAAELTLVALVAGYARLLSGEAARRHSLALDRMERLTEANALLFSLHKVTQALPASLDLEEVLDSTVAQLRDLFDLDSAAILLPDDGLDDNGIWQVARRAGPRLPSILPTDRLPPPLTRVVQDGSPITEPSLLEKGGPGLYPRAGSGMYAALRARGGLAGLVVVEHEQAHRYQARDLELLEGFVEPAALALDNARWFSRLRTVGAHEERTRIARDLHDRIGQSLAYLAFELDRLLKHGDGEDPRPALERLREDVRGVVREVRDTLYDLRTDVSESRPLGATLESFLERIGERSGLEISFSCEEEDRLPLVQEREMWRIAQEAVANVERHAKASRLAVRWWSDGRRAMLVVTDDGSGFPPGQGQRLDSYGLVGMRERAASIGARLDLESEPGKGTTVRCHLSAW